GDVGGVVAGVAAPGAGLGRVVEYRIEAPSERRHHRIVVRQVAAQLAHADSIQRRIVAAVEAGDRMAALDQASAQGLSQKSTTAGDEDLHVISKASCWPTLLASPARSWRCGGYPPGTVSDGVGRLGSWRCARSP